MRATYELEPAEWAETLAVLESTGVRDGAAAARGRVVSVEGGRATIDWPSLAPNLPALVSSVVAGEWADRADVARCRLVHVDWPEWLPGPAFEAPPRVLVGAIVKPSLGLTAQEAASVAAALAEGGADLVKDDELVCDFDERRIRAIASSLPESTAYAANVTGPHETLLERAQRALAAGATALMVNAFAQGLDALRALRESGLGVPLFAHRVGAAFLVRGETVSVAPRVLAELTRACGGDFVQVGSFTDNVHDGDDDVRAEIAGCHAPLPGGPRQAVAVIGGGVGPANAREQLARAGVREGVMLLLGSAAYAHADGVAAGVRAAVAAACAPGSAPRP